MEKVLIATPAYQYITPETQKAVSDLVGGTKRLQVVGGHYILYNQSLVPFARNQIVQSFMRSNADWLFFIDADVYFRNPVFSNAIDRLHKHGKDIISGVYVCKNPPFLPAVMTYERKANGDTFEEFTKYPNPHRVFACVTGFTLIHRRVFDSLGSFPFNLLECMEEGFAEGSQLPEDYSFCVRARERGFDSWVDSSIELFHVGQYGYSLTDFSYLAASMGLKHGDRFPKLQAKI